MEEFENPMESESSRQNVRVSFGLLPRPEIQKQKISQRSLTVAVAVFFTLVWV